MKAVQRAGFYISADALAGIEKSGIPFSQFVRDAIDAKLRELSPVPPTVSAEQLQALTDRVYAIESSLAKLSDLRQG